MKKTLIGIGAALCLVIATVFAQKQFSTLQPKTGDDQLTTLQKLLTLANNGTPIVTGGATAQNQADTEAVPGSDATKAEAVQGVTGGKPLPVSGTVSVNGLPVPLVFKSATATASGNTAVWTPAGGKKFRLMRFLIVATGDAASATSGITVKFNDGTSGATGLSIPVTVPTIAPTISAITSTSLTPGWVDLGTGVLSGTADNVLNVNLSAALTAGKIGVIACGTEE